MARMSAAAAPVLTRRVEWTFLRFVRGLYWPSGVDAIGATISRPLDPANGLAGAGPDRPLLAALGPVIARGTWRFRVRHGGYRSRDVITGGRKRTGRMWDEPIWGPASLTVSHATVLWLAVLWDGLAALHTRAPEALSRTLAFAQAARLSPGDRLALAAALTPFVRDRETWRQLPEPLRRIGRIVPLFGLAHPEELVQQEPNAQTEGRAASGNPEDGMPPEWSFDDPAEALALQYLDEWLVSHWCDAVLGRGRRDLAEVRAWDDGMVRAIDALFRTAAPSDPSGSDREHLLVPLVRFYPALVRRAGGMPELRRRVDELSRSIASTAEREAFESAFGTVLRGGVRLDVLVDRILATPWPDRTEPQKRLAAEYEVHYRPVREGIRQFSRTLRREVG